MIYNVLHRTTYRYKYPVSVGDHVACLKPRSFVNNLLLGNQISITPAPRTITERIDYFGNVLCFFTVQHPHKELVVESRSKVKIDEDQRHNVATSLPWEESAQQLVQDRSPDALEACQFQFESPRIRVHQEFAEYALQSFLPGRPMREALWDLTTRIHKDFRFDSR